MFFMQGLQKPPHFPTEYAFHRHPLKCHHVDIDATAAQSGRNLEPDEACPDYHDFVVGLSALDDLSAVRKGTQ